MKNPKYVDALRKVKKILAHKQVGNTMLWHICTCLTSLYDRAEITERTCHELRVLIMGRLNGRYELSAWLIFNSSMKAQDVVDDRAHNRGRKIQATRHRWVDALIEEFS